MTALLLAVEGDDVAMLGALVKRGANPNAADPRGRTALFKAKSKGAVENLVGAGANLEIRSLGNLLTPFLSLCLHGADLSVLKAVKDAGANVSLPTLRGGSCLHLACAGGSKANVSWLLDNAAEVLIDLNGRDRDGKTCLHISASSGDADMCRLLIARGANTEIGDNAGRTPIFHVRNKEVLVALLEGGAKLQARDNNQSSPLSACLWAGGTVAESIAMMDAFLAAGADIGARDVRGDSLLLVACERGLAHVVSRCLEVGADVRSTNRGGDTALHCAVRGSCFAMSCPTSFGVVDYPAVLRALVARGLPVDSVGRGPRNRETPLSVATDQLHGHNQDLDIVTALLELGADPAKISEDRGGATELLVQVCWRGDNALAERVLQSPCCNINGVVRAQMTALSVAAGSAHLSTVKLLISRGADPTIAAGDMYACAFAEAAVRGHEDVALYLLEQGIDVAALEGVHGPLHDAAYGCNVRIMKALVDRGASIHATGLSGITPLYDVTSSPHFNNEALQFLLGLGADIEAADLGGNRPLVQAVTGTRDKPDAVIALLASGADLRAKGEGGVSALWHAAAMGHVSICKALIEHGADIDECGPNGAVIHAAFRSADLSLENFLLPPLQELESPIPQLLMQLIESGARLDWEAIPPDFPFPSLDAGIAFFLHKDLKPQLCSRKAPITLHRKVLAWALASPAVAAALPGWMAELRRGEGPDFKRSLDWDSSMQLRKQKVSAIGDVAWDRRKELVVAYAMARKARHAAPADSSLEGAGAGGGANAQ